MIKNFFKKHSNNFQRFIGNYDLVKGQNLQQAREYKILQNEMAAAFPENIALSGNKVYSQTDEDGIIETIFKRIPNSKSFLEIGIQTGVECNSMYLLLNGWKGMWVEGSPEYCHIMNRELNGMEFKDKLLISNTFIDKDNIPAIFANAYSFFGIKEIDFFSLDIDGNDYYVMEQAFANSIFPKAVCVEYNAKFPPPMKMKIEYNKTHIWDGTDYQGCSLQSWVDLFGRNGYKLICCNLVGINAFFVKDEYAELFGNYTTEELYQPYRFYLSPINMGHKPSLHYLRNCLKVKY